MKNEELQSVLKRFEERRRRKRNKVAARAKRMCFY